MVAVCLVKEGYMGNANVMNLSSRPSLSILKETRLYVWIGLPAALIATIRYV